MGYSAIVQKANPRVWTSQFHYSCNAAADTINFFGPNQSSGSTTYPAQQQLNTSWGTGPTWFPYIMMPHAPVNSVLTRFSLWVRFNGPVIVEDVSIVKMPYVDLGTTGTPVLVATANLDSTLLTPVSVVYDFTVDVTTGNAFNAGDGFMMIRKSISGAAPYLGRAAVRFEEV